MPTFEFDFRFLDAGVSQLDNYLLSNDIYWSIGVQPPSGERPYPQLTLGTLLLSKERASVRAIHTNQKNALSELVDQIEKVHSKWRVAWERKATAEFQARLNLWSNFLYEYQQDPTSNYDRFGYEVSRRVMLELLYSDISNLPDAYEQLLNTLDHLLRTTYIPGDFVWDIDLRTAFSEKSYWYLYGSLPKVIEPKE